MLVLLFDKKKRYVLGLSKSMQFCSLASYHSEETAAAPDPPNAFAFFLGVTGIDTPK
jgi:hypothetical protein